MKTYEILIYLTKFATLHYLQNKISPCVIIFKFKTYQKFFSTKSNARLVVFQ